jgi:acyl-CoA synthetase (AMP-forming)/AMP-acid ligase II/1-acyl-sn-glycerol-3-phosphate acyltransferase/acyl carrier protein
MWKRCIVLSLCVLARVLLSLRYRITVKGLDQIEAHFCKRPGGVVFLPNHPAEIDPAILQMLLLGRLHVRPLVVEHFYRLKGVRWLMDLIDALPLPSMDERANKWRGKRVEKQFDHLVSALKKGGHFLVYPSGRLKVGGTELLGGASLAHKLLQECPEANVVLVRTTGLWGSRFSRALTGHSPDLNQMLWEGAKVLLKNGLFFTPRRSITVEFAAPPRDFPWEGTRVEVNRYLEQWYNRYPEPGPEPVQRVSSCFWREELPSVYIPPHIQVSPEMTSIDPRVVAEVIGYLSALCKKPQDEIQREMHLAQDLGLDSLDIAQVSLFLGEQFGVENVSPADLVHVEEVLQIAAKGGTFPSGDDLEEPARPFEWPQENRPAPRLAQGSTLQEVFLRAAGEHRSLIACVDALSGTLTYSQMKLRALILANRLKKLPGDQLGIMLPSSSTAYLIVLAVCLAGKVPVMLNWTTGAKALNHAVELTDLQVVLTSMKFLDRLQVDDLGLVEERFLVLEDVADTLSPRDKLKGFWQSLKGVSSLLRTLGLDRIDPLAPAVIVFTSGTEALPKGVPLSHLNLLSNQSASMDTVAFLAEDILYGVLPPFHSFGFSITGLLALLSGLRICYAPDPTDAKALARDIARWKPTLFICAPSFIRSLFRAAKPGELSSLRLIVSGAEKTPDELFQFVQENLPQAQLIEGYGITECSPVVTINRVNELRQGVGGPIPGLDLSILDLETRYPLPQGVQGEIAIAGPSVFSGYLGSVKDPFVILNGKRYYVSGDLGTLDAEGKLHLSGRLKRFVKIGGEMVGLAGLEEELLKYAQEQYGIASSSEGPFLAIAVRGRGQEKPELVLFTTLSVSKDAVNEVLKERGFGRITKVAQVRMLPSIPLMGTGKINYRLLEEMVENG